MNRVQVYPFRHVAGVELRASDDHTRLISEPRTVSVQLRQPAWVTRISLTRGKLLGLTIEGIEVVERLSGWSVESLELCWLCNVSAPLQIHALPAPDDTGAPWNPDECATQYGSNGGTRGKGLAGIVMGHLHVQLVPPEPPVIKGVRPWREREGRFCSRCGHYE